MGNHLAKITQLAAKIWGWEVNSGLTRSLKLFSWLRKTRLSQCPTKGRAMASPGCSSSSLNGEAQGKPCIPWNLGIEPVGSVVCVLGDKVFPAILMVRTVTAITSRVLITSQARCQVLWGTLSQVLIRILAPSRICPHFRGGSGRCQGHMVSKSGSNGQGRRELTVTNHIPQRRSSQPTYPTQEK